MRNRSDILLRLAAVIVLALLAPRFVRAFDLSTDGSGIYVVSWDPGTVPLLIRLPASANLSDGTSQSGSVVAATQEWNAQLGAVQLSPQPVGPSAYGIGNDTNEVAMDSTIGGQSFGNGVLAVTAGFRSGNTRIEADIIFNSAYPWDSYRGPRQASEDIRRVAIHELGHLLGLNHPDQAVPPQNVTAIMNHTVSDVDVLQPDDIAGGQALYGAPGFVPPNDNFADATVINLAGPGSVPLTGTNVAATAEPGEPELDARDPGRKTVWWRWTAPANGVATFTTLGSRFDTLLGVYTGASVANLAQVGLNDDEQQEVIRTSSLEIIVATGTTYHIAVDGRDGCSGPLQLNLQFDAGLPRIVQRPLSRLVTAGDAIAISVEAVDVGTMTYEWRRNGALVPGAMGATLNLNPVSVSDGGWYEVTVGGSGTPVRSFFQLHVAQPHGAAVGWGANGAGQSAVPGELGDVASLASGHTHGLAVRRDGSVVAWGDDQGGLGVLAVPANLGPVVAVSTHHSHVVALRADGTVAAWGYYAGIGVPAGLDNVIAVANGFWHSVALKSDGTVVGWGNNDSGQSIVPAAAVDVVALACGRHHTLALKRDGTVVAWGQSGQAKVPPGLTNVVAISSYWNSNLALRSDGTVVAWDATSTTTNEVPAGVTSIKAIAAGGFHWLALKADGTVVAWGSDSSGETDVPAGLTGVTHIAAGSNQSFAIVPETPPAIESQPQPVATEVGGLVTLTVGASGRPLRYQWRKNGAILVDGGSVAGATTASIRLKNIQPADAGAYSVVVSNDVGEVFTNAVDVTVLGPAITVRPLSQRVLEGVPVNLTVAATGNGQLSYEWKHDGRVIPGATGATLSLVSPTFVDRGRYEVTVRDSLGAAVSVAYLYVASSSARITGWGRNDFGQIQPPTSSGSFAGISAGRSHALAVRGDGSVMGWGAMSQTDRTYGTGLTDVVQVAAGISHHLALRSDGTVVKWGQNAEPEMAVPAGLANVVAIAACMYHNIALKADGTVVTWGKSAPSARSVPEDMARIVAVAAGENFSLALTADGQVREWGYVPYGTVPMPTDLADAVAIAASDRSSLAIRRDGSLAAWNEPKGLLPLYGDVRAVAAGVGHSVALRSDRSVVAWGYNGYGETVVPAGTTNVAEMAAGLNFSLVLFPSASGNPVIATHPVEQSVNPGTTSTFTVGSSGPGPLTYQWGYNGWPLANGGRISGAQSATLSIAGVTDADAGDYSVIVSNGAGATATGTSLEVVSHPVIRSRPLSRLAWVGEPLSLIVDAAGAGLTFAWKHNGAVIAGANGNTLHLPTVTLADSGRYEVAITNAVPETVRSVFWVHVRPPAASLVAWGANYSAYQQVPAGLVDVVEMSAGAAHTLGVRFNGKVVAWGNNNSGQLNVLTGLEKVVAVAAGGYTSFALRADGTVSAWGGSPAAQVPLGLKDVVAIVANTSDIVFALRADGSVVRWWSERAEVLKNLPDTVHFSTYSPDYVATRENGTIQISGGGTPAPPAGLMGVQSAVLGSGHGLALKLDGTVVGWGYNGYGQTTIPAGLAGVRSLGAGSNRSVALKSDGTVVAWGENYSGQSTVPAGLDGVFAIAVGYSHNFALIAQGNEAAPVVETPPTPQAVAAGATVSFTVQAFGRLLTYQWRRNGVALLEGANLSGTTSPTLTISNAHPGDAGNIDVVVTGGGGATTSATVAFEVEKLAQSILFPAPADIGFTLLPVPLSATASSNLPVTFSVVGGPATVSGSLLTLTGAGVVTVRASQPGNGTYAAAPSVDRSFTVLGGLDSWRAAKFSVPELADNAISGPTADPDGDGLTNLLEYALGLEPKSADTVGLPELTVVGGEWVYTYTRPADRADLSYAVEFTTDLAANNWSTAGVIHESVTVGGATETWRARVPLAGAPNTFFRLRVEVP